MWKKLLLVMTLFFCVLVLFLLYRTSTQFSNRQVVVDHPLKPVELDRAAVLQRFARALQIPTISYDQQGRTDQQAFADFRQLLANSYPLIYQTADVRLINGHSLLFTFAGKDPSLKPALLMGHMDVVPADPQTLNEWKHQPFSGDIADGAIWGRGAIDDKVTVMSLMEAMEKHLEKGHQFKRTLYFAFGHDEEVGGRHGAKAIAAYLASQHVTLSFVLDEGGAITSGLLNGVKAPVAMVGIAEKGFVNLRLQVKGEGGHSSQPPAQPAVTVLAQALLNVQQQPFANHLAFLQRTFDAVGFASPLSSRIPMANLWLFGPLVEHNLLAKPSSAASLHTTIAPTMLTGSAKSNVLPSEVSAVINLRILPGETVESVREHVIEAIDDDRVTVSVEQHNNPSPVSSTHSFGYRLIEKTIRRLDPEVLVAPYLVQGGTDSRYYYPLTDNIYRFVMVRLDAHSIKRFHGINEQIPTQDYMQAIQFYYGLLQAMTTGLATAAPPKQG